MNKSVPIFETAAQHENQIRRDFELREQRHMVPLFIVAALAAAFVHVLAFRASPFLLRLWQESFDAPHADRTIQEEEVIRVVVRDTEADMPEAKESPPTEKEMDPEELPPPDPVEIDLLDIETPPDLVIAPGETSIPLPEPQKIDNNSVEQAQMMPEAPALNLPTPDLEMGVSERIPEPTPINANDVVANATPQLDELADAEGALRREATKGNSALPPDTRTLAQLMGLDHLGAKSGVARLGADLLFAFDDSRLKNSARISLLQLAALIHKNPSTTFIIEGHTDGIGTPEYNANLSLRRAKAVADWLAGNGVPIKRVYLRACGSTRPLADTRLPRDRQAMNRRVEIHMRQPGERMPEGCVEP